MNYITFQRVNNTLLKVCREKYIGHIKKIKDFLCLMKPILQCVPSCSMMI